MNSRTIVQKADLAVQNLIDDGGYLNPEQADRFLEIIHTSPTILPSVRKVTMTSPIRKIPKIGFGNRIARAAPRSGTALEASKRAKPTFDQIELVTEELIAEVPLPYDALEDNIERGGLENTILTLMGKQLALDLEELILLGDTTNTTDDYLALQNGALALTPTANTIDASAITDVTRALFKLGIHSMPDQHLRNRNLLKFFTSVNVETEYRDHLAGRDTQLGDDKTVALTPCYAFGSAVVPASLMPDDKIWFCSPQNMILGVQRDIMIETDKDIRARMLTIVLTMRIATAMEEPTASIVLKDFSDAGLPA